jgi:hypothetical protein
MDREAAMDTSTSRRWALAVAGAFLTVVVVASGIWLLAASGGGGVPQPPAATPSATADVMTVHVYFHRHDATDPATVVSVARVVPRSSMVATATLDALLAGPTATERGAGYWSHFSTATAGMLHSVRIGNGVAHADFRDFSRIIPNASSSFGSAALLAELDATLKQFATVQTTVYSFDGDVAAFYEWLQMVPPAGAPTGVSAARSTARDFLTKVVGMKELQDGEFRWIAPGTVAVDFRAVIPEDGRTIGAATPVTVTLQRNPTSWTVLGTTTASIEVTTPARMQVVTSPLALRGRAEAYEGTVQVRVVQVTGATVTDLGTGFVTGGALAMGSFSGSIPFTAPRPGTGWVLCYEETAINGDVVAVTAVPVRFAGVPLRPHILDVTPASTVDIRDGWVTLNGISSITLTVRATSATRLRLYLAPLLSGAAPNQPVATATRSGDTFTVTWRCQDEPLLARLVLQATGLAGSTDLVLFDIYHP